MDQGFILMTVLMVGVMFVFIILPDRKRKRAAAELRNSLEVGDEITTTSGIVGKIVHVKDEFVTFETGEDRVRIKIAKWGISAKGRVAEEQQTRR